MDYRERHVYFGKNVRILDYPEFAQLDEEQRQLDKKGDDRDDEEEARWRELGALLFRD